jgi:hypothetical protein
VASAIPGPRVPAVDTGAHRGPRGAGADVRRLPERHQVWQPRPGFPALGIGPAHRLGISSSWPDRGREWPNEIVCGFPDIGAHHPSPLQQRLLLWTETRPVSRRRHRIDGASSRLPPDRWSIEPARPRRLTGVGVTCVPGTAGTTAGRDRWRERSRQGAAAGGRGREPPPGAEGRGGSEAGVDGLGFQGEDGEDALVHPPERLAAGDAVQGFEAEGVFAQGEGAFVGQAALA